MKHPAYAKMLQVTDDLRAFESFATDLTRHDARWLDEHDSAEPFGWCFNPHGTHLFPTYTTRRAEREGRSPADIVDAVARNFDTIGWFWWDGTDLHKVSRQSLQRKLRRARRAQRRTV